MSIYWLKFSLLYIYITNWRPIRMQYKKITKIFYIEYLPKKHISLIYFIFNHKIYLYTLRKFFNYIFSKHKKSLKYVITKNVVVLYFKIIINYSATNTLKQTRINSKKIYDRLQTAYNCKTMAEIDKKHKPTVYK